jgi:hypothetical protein
MRWVVFLRAVNVGKANRCHPALIAKQLTKFGVVNIGAVGTFVVREDVRESALRTLGEDPWRVSAAGHLLQLFGISSSLHLNF